MKPGPSIFLRYRKETSLARRITLGITQFRRDHGLDWGLFGPGRSAHDRYDVCITIQRFATGRAKRPRGADLHLAVLDPSMSPADRAVHLPFDHVAAGRLAADHFASRGFRCFGYISDSPEAADAGQIEGFTETIRKSGSEVVRLRLEPAGEGRLFEDWLSEATEPSALFCVQDQTALRAIDRALEIGQRVPSDLAVIGSYNGEIDCELGAVPLSSLRWDGQAIGRRLGAAIQHYFESGEFPQIRPFPPLEVATRMSSDVIAVADPAIAISLQRIHRSLDEPIQVIDLCRAVHMGRSAFERRFRKALGESPGAYLQRQRLQRAKGLLLSSDLTVATVAHHCGLDDARSLFALFRRHENCSPAQWRDRARH